MKHRDLEVSGEGRKIARLARPRKEADRELRMPAESRSDAGISGIGRPYLLREAGKTLLATDEALREAADTQAAILNALPAHVALIDSDGVVLSVNESWRRFARQNGMQNESFGVGQNYLDVCRSARGDFSEGAQATATGILGVLRGESKDFTIEYPCNSPWEQRWFCLQVKSLYEDRLSGAVLMHVDISERKRAEQAMRESEERLRESFDQAPVGIAHVSTDGRYIRVNDKLCEIVGFPRQELLGMSFLSLTVPEDRSGGVEAHGAMLAGKLSYYTTEKRYRRKNGDTVWTNLVTTLDRTAAGEPKYFISVVKDITLRKLAELRLLRLNRLHTVLSRINETSARTSDRQQLYESVCRILVEDGMLRAAVIIEVNGETRLARPLALFGAAVEYFRDVTISTDGPMNPGSVSAVIRTGIHNFSNDIAIGPRFDPWHKIALQHGCRSTASFPLKRGDATIGALMLYAGEAGYFRDDELRLMDAVANDVSFALEAQHKEQERQRAESALRVSEANMTAAQRISHFGSWELDIRNHDDIEANTLRWSDEMFRITGHEPGAVEVNSELFFRLIPDEEHGLVRHAIATAIQERRPYSLVHRFIRPDGTARVVREAAQIFFDEETGLPFRLIGTCQDITEKRMAEKAIEKSEEQRWHLTRQLETERSRLIAAQSVAKVGSWETDLAGSVIWSDEMHRICGTDPAIFHPTQRRFMRLVHPEDRSAVLEAFVGSLHQPSTRSVEHRLLLPDGRIKFVDERWQAVLDESGKLVRTIGTSQDITERKRAADKLEELSQRTERRERILTTTLSFISDFAYIYDREGRFLFVNQPLLDLWGIPLEQAVGKNFFDLGYPPDLAAQLQREIQQVFETGESLTGETPYTNPDGLEGFYEYIFSPVSGAGGIVEFVVGSTRDITERKREAKILQRAKDAAEAANQAKREFLANMSHEIRTPMNGVVGMTDLVLDTELTAEQREHLEIVKSSAHSLLTIINDILDFSRAEAGKLKLDSIDFDFRDAIGDTARAVALKAHQKGLELIVDVGEDVPQTLTGDPGRLRQILVNLLGNAIKFTSQGEVLLRVTSDGMTLPDDMVLHLSIRDTGVGIPLDRQKTIFEAFAQADGSTTRAYGGTGLGLTISSQLVQLMGGRLWVESEAGTGSTFHFTAKFRLPEDAYATAPVRDAVDLRGLPVLVVDDNATNRRLLGAMLAEWQMVPMLSASAHEALAAMRMAQKSEQPFKLVLTDFQMPDASGFALAELIGKDPAIAGAAIVMLTSAGQPGDAARFREAGIAAYLPKPIKRSELRVAITTALDIRPSEKDRMILVPPQLPQKARQSARVLLVEDNPVNQLLARRLLEKRGYTVVMAHNGREALTILDKEGLRGVACVLMDIQMPDMGGIECTAIIRQREGATGSHLPIIAMTAHAMHGDEAACLASGMDAYLSKPIQPEKLFNIIERCLSENVADSANPENKPL